MINLLPPNRLANIRIARSNTMLRRYIEFSLVSVLVLIVAVVAAYYLLHSQQVNTQKTVDVDAKQIQQLEPVQKQAEQLSTTVNTIAGLLSRNVKFSDMLTQIGGLMPPGSVLTGLQFSVEDLKSPLVISAQVDTQQKAAILRNNLASSNLFSKADIQTISQINAQGESSNSGNAPLANPTAPPATNAVPASNSPYKFTTVINAYFKDTLGDIK